jgi:RHS repeat-associated protein
VSRAYSWSYDRLYRLTNESISSLGSLAYAYDRVSNRTNRGGTLGPIGSASYAYNTNDWLTTDSYDANGNTTNSVSIAYAYDWANRLTNSGLISIVYNADGHRIKKTTVTTTTLYLVDERNLTGYPQVLEELTVLGSLTNLNRAYTYGLDLVSQWQSDGSVHFYGYDGHGSVRFLANGSGTITDTYAYDAYGTLIASNGTTPNVYLSTGERFDPDLGLYSLGERYLKTDTGRFLTTDSFEGFQMDAHSLHKYLYAHADPVNRIDPSGHFSLAELQVVGAKIAYLASRIIPPVLKAYGRAMTALDAIQDVAMIASILADGDVDEEESEILYELIEEHVKSRLRGYAVRMVTGAGGTALGVAVKHVGRLRITKAAIQQTREWYRKHKVRYSNTTVQTVAGPVNFDQHGWPDFSKYLYKGKKGLNTVHIQLSGSRRDDFRLANKQAGFGDSPTAHPEGYTWHHNQKLGKMELVRQDAHSPNANGNEWHDGAVAIFKRLYGWGYTD